MTNTSLNRQWRIDAPTRDWIPLSKKPFASVSFNYYFLPPSPTNGITPSPTHTRTHRRFFWLKSYNLAGQIIYHFRWISFRIVGADFFQFNGTLLRDSARMIEEWKKKWKKKTAMENVSDVFSFIRRFVFSKIVKMCVCVCDRFEENY